MTEQDPHDQVLSREEEDDHDLLTYGEAGARITEEIAAEKERLAVWEQRVAAGEPVAEQCERSRVRLEQLRGAAQRNARPPITDDNFERFFGYKGTPRRNT